MRKVAVLGCGPAGLLAAHAARMCGDNATIFSKKRKSPMQGAQYMHVEIPEIRLPSPEIIKYMLVGTASDYRHKVYNSGDPDIVVSPDQYLGEHKCWDLRHTYAKLWLQWHGRIVDHIITQDSLRQLIENHDVVISTIPATALCQNRDIHSFGQADVMIDNLWAGPTPADDHVLWRNIDHLIICNGLPIDKGNKEGTGWYRTSHIYRHTNTEWSAEWAIPAERARRSGRIWRVPKPISTNCDCWPNIIRCGRFGKWTKGVLTHHAFEETLQILS